MADKIYNRFIGPSVYGYYGGVWGLGYPGYYPAYHPSNAPTGETMGSVYPYYPMDSVAHIDALRAYHDKVIAGAIADAITPTLDTVKKVLDIVTDTSKMGSAAESAVKSATAANPDTKTAKK